MTSARRGGGRFPSWRSGAAALPLLALFALGLVLSPAASAATRTWTGLGPTNNWSDALNWSGGVVPGAADVATFDATSAKNATIAAAVNVAGVSIGAGYAGTITQSAGIGVTVGATGFSQAGGTFVGGTTTITLNGPLNLSGGSFSATNRKKGRNGRVRMLEECVNTEFLALVAFVVLFILSTARRGQPME